MAGMLPPVVVELVASIKQFEAQMAKAKGELASFEAQSKSSFANFQKFALVGGAVAAAALVGAGVMIVKAYQEDMEAQNRLRTALENTGSSYEKLSPKLNAAASAMAKFGYEDDVATTALAQLVTSTGNATKAQQLLSVAADVAAYKHISLSSAALLVGKAATGSTRALVSMGISTDGLGKASDYTNGKLGLGEAIVKKLGNTIEGTADKQAKTFSGSMAALGATMGNLVSDIATQLAPAIEFLSKKIAEAATWLQEHKAVLIGVAAVIGGILVIAIAAATAALISMAVAWVAATWPILAIVAAIGAVVAVMIYLWNTNEGFRNAVMAVWGAIKDAISSVVDNIKQKISENQEKIDALKNAFSVFWDFLRDKVIPLLVTFYSVYLQVLIKIFTVVINIIVEVINVLVNFIFKLVEVGKAVWDFAYAVGEAITKAVQFVIALPGKVIDALKSAGTWLVETGKNMIQGLLDGAASLLSKIGEFFLDKLPSWIVWPFKKALGIESPSKVFFGFGQNIVQGLVDGAADGEGTVLKVFSDLGKSVISAYKSATSTGLVDSTMAALGETIQTINLGKGKWADAVRQSLTEMFTSLKDKVEEAKAYGESISKSLTSGLSIGTALDEAIESGGNIINAFLAQGEKIKEFSGKLTTLLKAGLNKTTYDEIASMSADRGIQVANAFLDGNIQENIRRTNEVVTSVKKVAEDTGKASMDQFMATGVSMAVAFMTKLIEAVSTGKTKNQLMAAMDKLAASLNRNVTIGVSSPAMGVAAGANSYVPTQSSVGSYTPMAAANGEDAAFWLGVTGGQSSSAPTNNITVNAQTNADANAIANEIAWAMAVGV